MNQLASRCSLIGRKVFRRDSVWTVLDWVISSITLTQLANFLSGYVLCVGISGWFLVIPVALLFEVFVVFSSLLCLLHRWGSVFQPTMYILTIRNTRVDNPWVGFSFTPFSESDIRELEEVLVEQDRQLWGEEALWEYGKEERRIAYLDYTAEFKISLATIYRAYWQQWSARQP